jgi:glycosyltransferase involved in cell wall biosynthesis
MIPEDKILINLVISKDMRSGIFYDIFKRFFKRCNEEFEFIVSESPFPDADIYHYHRPHLEKQLCKPAVITVHHDLNDLDPWLDSDAFINRYKESDAVVCLNSIQEADLYMRGISGTRIIPHGYDDNIFSKQKKERKSDSQLTIGLISKYYGRRVKGDVYLEELVERLSPGDVRFLLVGDGRDLTAQMIRSLGYDAEVFVRIPYRMFGSLYQEIDLLLMCSNYEGGPANLPEALASSTPVLATNCGMVPDLVENEVSGLILTGDINKDFPVIKRVFDKKDRLLNQLFLGAHKSENEITWDEVIDKHFELYREIVQRNQKR